MFEKKLKIEVNDNFNMILNYINSANELITYKELVQYCIDYELYKELFVNLKIFQILIEERNEVIQKTLVPEIKKDLF